MLPMNKLVEDVAEFLKQREEEVKGTPATAEEVQERRDEIILFANEMSDKYEELVSVELVDTLILSYQDSVDDKGDVEDPNSAVKQEHLTFLDSLRREGSISMGTAKGPLMKRFPDLTESQASCALDYWMKYFKSTGTKKEEV